MTNRLLTYLLTTPSKYPLLGVTLIIQGKTEPDQPQGFVSTAAPRPGNAAGRNGQTGTTAASHPIGHGYHHRRTDGTVLCQQGGWHPQQLLFDAVGIGHHPLVKPAGTAGNSRDGIGQPPASAGFGRSHPPLARQ